MSSCKNNKLYSDDHPQTTIKNMGFANKEKAEHTLNILENLDSFTSRDRWKTDKERQNYVQQVLVTMYYRAKHHPKRTKKMEEAMHVFRDYVAAHKNLNVNLK